MYFNNFFHTWVSFSGGFQLLFSVTFLVSWSFCSSISHRPTRNAVFGEENTCDSEL